MENNFNTPKEILKITIQGAKGKVEESSSKKLLQGILGGIYVALASYGFVFCKTLFSENPSLGTFIGAVLFPTALMMVVVCGAELFTGNSLMVALGLEDGKNWKGILINWVLVWIGNFIGSVLIALIAVGSGKFISNPAFGITAVNVALGKVNYSFLEAFSLGILCNLLVAGAVWMSTASKDVPGKIFSCFFPVMLFVFSGFEHSVANMYYLMSGFFASLNPEIALNIENSDLLNMGSILIKNLIPVSIGNAVGGAILIAGIYWLIHRDKA